MSLPCVLFVEPEESLRRGLNAAVRDRYQIECAADGTSAILRATAQRIDVLVTAATLPDIAGTDLIQRVLRLHPRAATVVIANDDQTSAAMACLELGAVDLLRRPFTAEALRQALRIAAAIAPSAAAAGDSPIVAESAAMQRTLAQLRALADHPTPVLLAGEPGTGLESLARLLHASGPHASGPFVRTSCCTISEAALDSALFGHTNGWLSSSGPSHRDPSPAVGTLFLNQIECLSLPLQAKLLRSLKQTHAARGAARLALRIVASTNADLNARIDDGRILPELAYRLSVARVEVAPLRERTADVGPLAVAFLREFCADAGLPRKRLGGDAIDLLAAYPWPGNVGELREIIERAAAVTGDATVVLPDDLPAAIAATLATATPVVPFPTLSRRGRLAPKTFVAPVSPKWCHPIEAPGARSDGKWTPQLWACVHPFPTLRATGPDDSCEGCPIWEQLCRQRVASGA